MAYVVARLFDWRALFGNYMSRHQKKPHRPYPAPQEQQQQGRPENGQPPAPKPFNMRRVVAISFALAVAIVLLSYGVNRREQAAQSVEPPMASDTGVIPDSEAQAEERAARRAASQEKGMTAPADDASAAGAASEPGGLDAASDASAASAW